MRRLVASWFGSGLILGRVRDSDLGSGTIGSLVALPMALLIGTFLGWPAQVAAAGLVTALSLWAARPWADVEGDPGWIVVDEAAGTFVAVIGLPVQPALLAWAVFRLADIKKDWAPGVAAAERLPGALGVTADDVVAGVYGLVVGHVVWALL